MVFVDYKQVYESTRKPVKSYKKAWVPEKLTRMIRTCIQNFKYIIKFNGQLSKEFMVNTEIKQEDTLSLTQFNIVLEEVVRKVLNVNQTSKI